MNTIVSLTTEQVEEEVTQVKEDVNAYYRTYYHNNKNKYNKKNRKKFQYRIVLGGDVFLFDKKSDIISLIQRVRIDN